MDTHKRLGGVLRVASAGRRILIAPAGIFIQIERGNAMSSVIAVRIWKFEQAPQELRELCSYEGGGHLVVSMQRDQRGCFDEMLDSLTGTGYQQFADPTVAGGVVIITARQRQEAGDA